MNKVRRIRNSLFIMVLLVILSGLSIGSIYYIQSVPKNLERGLSIACGLVFWLSISATIASSSSAYRRYVKKYEVQGKRKPPGIISFFSNKESTVFTVLFVIIVGAIILDTITAYMSELALFVSIACALIAFGMHCILDGRVYIFFKSLRERKNSV